MFCTQCGNNMPDNVKFCTGCGAKLGGNAPDQPISQEPKVEIVNEPKVAPQAETEILYERKEVEQTVAKEPQMQQNPNVQPQRTAPVITPIGMGQYANAQGGNVPPNYNNPNTYNNAPQYNQNLNQGGSSEVVSIGEWIKMYILMMIPICNIVMLIIWAVSGKKQSVKNFARASFIFTGIMIVLGIILSIIGGACIASLVNSYYYY